MNDKSWFAIYTGYKKEKFVQRMLTKKGIKAYVPVISRVKDYNRKRKVVHLPLITCYVFVFSDKSEYVRILQTEYVHGFVSCRGEPLPIPEAEIGILKRIVGDSKVVDVVKRNEIHRGKRVELVAGALTGIKGEVVERSGKDYCLVELETLGYALLLEVGLNQLRLVA